MFDSEIFYFLFILIYSKESFYLHSFYLSFDFVFDLFYILVCEGKSDQMIENISDDKNLISQEKKNLWNDKNHFYINFWFITVLNPDERLK